MGGKASRDKGNRREREFVHRLEAVGIPAARVPLSGAVGGDFSGDIRFGNGHLAECKSRKNGSGFKTIEGWLTGNDFLFLQRDRTDPFVCMTWDMFTEILLADSSENTRRSLGKTMDD